MQDYHHHLSQCSSRCQSCHWSLGNFQKDCQCITCDSCLFLNDSKMRSKLNKPRQCMICRKHYSRVVSKLGSFDLDSTNFERYDDEQLAQKHPNQSENPVYPQECEQEQFIDHDPIEFFEHQTDFTQFHEHHPDPQISSNDTFANQAFVEVTPPLMLGNRRIDADRTQEVLSLLRQVTPRNLLSQLEECY